MFARNVRRGQSLTSLIVGLVVLVVLGLGAYYLISKPFQGRVNEQFTQATEWTPENIQADPVGYLTWALTEVAVTEGKLESSLIALKTKRNEVGRVLQKNEADRSQYERLLDDMKTAFREASTSGQWPARIREATFEESGLKRKIVEVNDMLSNVSSLIDTYKKTDAVLDRKLTEVDSKLAEVVKLKNRLSTDLEIAKVNRSVEGLEGINDQVAAIADTTSALVSTTDEGISVEDLIKPTADARVNSEFDKIMSP